MKVLIILKDETLEYDEGVAEAGPSGTFFRVVLNEKEQTTPTGLVARVGGQRRHVFVPASAIVRVEVSE